MAEEMVGTAGEDEQEAAAQAAESFLSEELWSGQGWTWHVGFVSQDHAPYRGREMDRRREGRAENFMLECSKCTAVKIMFVFECFYYPLHGYVV